MFEKDKFQVKILNREGLQLKGYFQKINNDKCLVNFCGFGGCCDKVASAIAEACERSNISFLFGNTQGSYDRKVLKLFDENGNYVKVEKGACYEDFDKCVGDVSDWLKFAEKEGFKEIYLTGASIACNRIINYLNKYEFSDKIRKIVLICPQNVRPQIDLKMFEEAKKFVSLNQENQVLTDKFFGYCDVTAKTYFNMMTNNELDNLPYLENRSFDMLKNVKLPIRVVIGSEDEGIVDFSDKSAEYYMNILKNHHHDLKYKIVEEARHNFKNKEQELAETVLSFILK